MLTIDDVAAVPLFSSLPAANLERLARTAADLHLSPGEFAVPERGECALFAVLSGKIEVVKTFDGIERRLGWRVPGTICGEAPIALGTPFPGGYRAAEPSRVMRVDMREYYTLAAASQDVSLKVSALARERLGGLQSVTAEPQRPRVILVGHRWDTACGTLRRFLARNQISFHWLPPDAETEWLPVEIARDARGYVLTGDDVKKAGRWSESRDPYLLETSAPGVFACGDVRLSPVKRVASAVGEGSMAIAFVHQYLSHERQSRINGIS